MGGQQSQPKKKKNDDVQQCCYFLPSPLLSQHRGVMIAPNGGGNKTKNSSNNADLGTPLPDTPLFQRKRRQQVQEAMRSAHNDNSNNHNNDPVFSSKYNGLEKEVSSGSCFLKTTAGGAADNAAAAALPRQAEIHEGPDCEQELWNKYELMEVIGVGSTSTVHRCVAVADGQEEEEYACKIIDCLLIEERFQGMMEQFETEIQALRCLQHPGIIQLFDVYLTETKIYIVMELMQGGELFDYVVQKGTLTEGEASQIVRKVTSAMVYMHSKNICHRDLKPENLLLKEKPTNPHDPIDVKIIDFGLSKAMEEPVARTFLGTRGYLAPEMLQRREYDRAVDTWALGVIVFVLLCGCLPFDDDSATVPTDELIQAKFVLRFPRWAKNLSPSAKNLLSHLLDINPVTRYTAEQALADPWCQGKTAPKENLLASPGRIRTSPYKKKGAGAVSPYNTTSTSSAAGQKQRATQQQQQRKQQCARRSPPTPKPMVRKKSI